MWKLIDNIFDRVISLAGALVFSQAPSFMQQYTQRLAGRVDELAYQLQKLRQIAELTGKTLPQYIQKFISSSDPEFMAQGGYINDMMIRTQNVSNALKSLQEANIFSRPFLFIRHLQKDVFIGTWKSYVPGINLSIEGFVYACVGLLIGYFIYQGFKKLMLKVVQYVRNLNKKNQRVDTCSSEAEV